jgi:hypothetical protein
MVSLAKDSILFVMAPGGMSRRFPEHLGTAFLRTVVRRAGIGARQYLPKENPSLRGFGGFLRESRPRVVGFTVYESNLTVSRAMVRAVRQTLPESVILLGGPNATFTPDETLDLVGADACMRGAGEGTIVPLVRAILGSESASTRFPELLRDVPNLVLRTRDGNCRTPPGDLASFPAAYFRTLDDIPSPFQDEVVSSPDVGYLTARGCNQNCTYCSFAAVSGRRVAFHGVERVLDDLEALEALVARTSGHDGGIDILDDAFTLVPERARRICEGILDRGIRLLLRCETRADRVNPDLLRLMSRAGFTDIAFGLESAVPRVLRTIGKVRAPDTAGDPDYEAEREYLVRFREAVESARRCGLNVSVSVMGGLPGETADDFRTTLDFVSSLGIERYAHNLLSLLPGTPLYERRHAFGLEVFRERPTAIWRTVHAYPAGEVRPLSGSTLHSYKWSAAEALANALCGRPGAVEAGGGSVWAVVLHGCPRSKKLATWLRRRLAIAGTVVAFVDSRYAVSDWSSFLTRSGVPFGELVCLVPEGSTIGKSFESVGSLGKHRVRFVSAYSSDVAATPVQVDEIGDCAISVWLASAPDARIEGDAKPEWPLIGPGLQIGDSCRLGITSPCCLRPQVLHVDSDGWVRACWHGPVLEVVGRTRDRHTRNSSGCPLGVPSGMSREAYSSVWDVDLASQLNWLFPRGREAREGVGPAGAGRSVT